MTGATPTARRPRATLGAILHSVGGQFSYVMAQMVVLAALARFTNAATVGGFGLAMAIATPVFLMANMGLRTGVATDVAGRHGFGTYMGLTLGAALGGLVVTLALGLALVEGAETWQLIAIVAAMKLAESVSKTAYGVFQLRGTMRRVAWSLTLRGWISAAVFTALLAAGVPMQWAFVAQLVVWSLVAALLDYPAASVLMTGAIVPPRFARAALWSLARENAPLSVAGLLNSLLASAPRFALGAFVGIEAVGIYTAVAYIQQAGTMVIDAVNQALLGRFALWTQNGQHARLRRAARRILAVVAVLAILGVAVTWALGETLLTLVFGPEFAGGSVLLLYVALALATKLIGIVPQVLMQAHRRFVLFMVYEATSLGLCLALLWLLVPQGGLAGAGQALLAVAVFRLGFLLTSSRLRGGKGSGQPATKARQAE